MSTDPREKGEGWIGVDFDGTLAHYDHYRGDDHCGAPIEPMVRRVRKWMMEGKDVRLFTARKPHPALRKWMFEHLGAILPITNTKDSHMIALYDDRVVQVVRNEGKTSAASERQIWGDDHDEA
jgi:hypothetical protein